jgi:hypothetical protein
VQRLNADEISQAGLREKTRGTWAAGVLEM